MKFARFCVCSLAAMLLAGCHGGGNMELLERDLRHQEEKLYYLEDQLDQCQAMLEASRRENESLKQEMSTGDKGAAEGVRPPSIELGPSSPRRNRLRRGPPMPPIEPPKIELPSSDSPGVDISGPSLGQAAVESEPADQKPVKLVLNKQLTGGRDQDGRGGDESLMVVVEPRNAADELVSSAGELSVAVLDPAKTGAAARVARWDFSSAEAAAHFKKTLLGRGYHFELPWPSNPPTSRTLQLFVRLVTADGGKLSTQATIEVDPPGQQANRWTRAPHASHERAQSQRSLSARATRDRTTAPAAQKTGEPLRPLPAQQRTGRPTWKPYR